MSRIGTSPIPVPSGVEVTISGRHVAVKGPKGTLQRDIPGAITIRQTDGELIVERPDDERESRAMHGLVRSLVDNMEPPHRARARSTWHSGSATR